ncbi:MAG: UvrD-helicase domain-containing protein [Treponema sp.]|jgi:DNA helicase-2/ATP-dependent DNA helicase PcrA|nr:UvrD-helicase domain-containing protein [Treponema sp.]
MSLDLHQLKQELNPEQYRAVTTLEGPILIIAGAGSGKTRVITYRIANMLSSGIPQSQILALTFTNKAAKEMEGRIKELTGRKLQNLTVSTFHAFGVKILRAHITALGWRDNFSIYDDTDRKALIKETGRELKFTADALDLYKIGTLFSDIKMGRKSWQGANDMYRGLYEGYQEGLKLFNAVDFDDLIMLPIRLFKEYSELRAEYRNHYPYIMVDEFQDTSRQQYELMHLLADRNVAVVGDDDQSIYSWRGADYKNILQFEKDFPDVTEIRLEQNYRSTETILAAANGVISHNTNRKTKTLWSGNGSGKPIEIFMPENEAAEAEFIAESIQGIAMEEKRMYDDFGVLMRANTQSRPIEEAFLEANIPYTMSGGTSFFQRKEIKDIISYLRVIANHDDDVNLLRILNTPRRGIGRSTLGQLNDTATSLNSSLWTAIDYLLSLENGPLSEKTKADLQSFKSIIENNSGMISGKGLAQKVRALVDEIGYWDYLIGEYQKSEKAARYKFMNIESLIRSIDTWKNNPNNYEATLYTYLNRITLLSRDDMGDDEDKGKVNLMTIHASKGLEFPVVFIAGAEEGLIPHARSLEENENNVEEERRLFYVAITRARDKLLISACRKRRRMQAETDCVPSRFLDEIPPNLVEYHEETKEVDPDTAQKILAQMKKRFTVPGF